MNKKKLLYPYILLVIGIVVLINVLASRFFFRADFTEDKRYTLSTATRDLLADLQQPVTITAYFSKGLPPNIDQTRIEFKDMLAEYATRSRGNIVYEFIDPNKDPMTEQQAVSRGISPVVINVREKDQSVQKKAYLGAVLTYGEKSEVIPFVQPGAAMEYALSSAIKKLVIEDKNLVGFIQGHGEATLSEMMQARETLEVLNAVESVNLTDSTYLAKYKTLVIVAPTDSFPEKHLKMFDDYLAQGGNMIVALNRVNGDLQQSMGTEVTTGLEDWLSKKHIEVEPDFVIDQNCGSVSVVQRQGIFSFTTQVSFPYLPLLNTFADHPITAGMEGVMMQFASPLRYTGDSTLTFTPLVSTSEKSGKQSAPLYFDIQHRWTTADFSESHLTVAGLLEGKIAGEKEARLLVIGDGDFVVNGLGQQAQQLSPDNVNLLVNAVDWMSDDTGLIELRTKGVTSRMLEPVEEGTKTLLKWLNFLLPILLIVVYGLLRVQRNRLLREKRRNPDFNR